MHKIIIVSTALFGALTFSPAMASVLDEPNVAETVQNEAKKDSAPEAKSSEVEPKNGDGNAVTEKTNRTRAISDRSRDAELTHFDGAALLKKAGRLRIWRSSVNYTLTVDADGTASDCTMAQGFRQKYTEIALCQSLMSNHTFEPARDAHGNPVEGTYSNQIIYRELRKELEG